MAVKSPAASFVTNVLATSGHLDKEVIQSTILKLSRGIDDVKAELHDALKKAVNFQPHLNNSLELKSRIEQLSSDIQDLSNKIQNETKGQLDFSAAEFEDLAQQMAESKLILSLLQKLLTIKCGLQSINSSLKQKKYLAASEELKVLNACLRDVVHAREGEIRVLAGLRSQCQSCQLNLQESLSQEWSQHLHWRSSSVDDSQKEVTCELTIKSDNKAVSVMREALRVLHSLDLLQPKVDILADRFYTMVLQPIVLHDSTTVRVKSNIDSSSLLIKHNPSKNKAKSVPLKAVFSNFKVAISFLHQELLSIELESQNEKTLNLMTLFSNAISSKCQTFIVDHCLMPSVPTSNQGMMTYAEETKMEITHSHEFLVGLGFIEESDSTLTDFLSRVNVVFADKKTQEVMSKARHLMTSDVLNLVPVSSELPFGKKDPGLTALEGSSGKKSKNLLAQVATKLSPNTFNLPECMISEYVLSLVKLCYETLHEATSTDSSSTCQLVYAARYIFELFCSVVPTYHKESLLQLAQRSAVHHNDCMYLAHHGMLLGPQFAPGLPTPQMQQALTFLDFVPKLKRLGVQCFLDQMTKQKEQLMELLSGAQGFMSAGEEGNEERYKQIILQMMHQLQHLANVWHGVLPKSTFCKSIGTLLDSVLSEVIAAVTALEDISKDDGVVLHSLLHLIAEKSLKLYAEAAKADDSVPTALLMNHVSNWNKLKELELLMNLSLMDISNRWAEGKGPLAAEFKAHEVKQLIRALFQNTDRRANVLSKIH